MLSAVDTHCLFDTSENFIDHEGKSICYDYTGTQRHKNQNEKNLKSELIEFCDSDSNSGASNKAMRMKRQQWLMGHWPNSLPRGNNFNNWPQGVSVTKKPSLNGIYISSNKDTDIVPDFTAQHKEDSNTVITLNHSYMLLVLQIFQNTFYCPWKKKQLVKPPLKLMG